MELRKALLVAAASVCILAPLAKADGKGPTAPGQYKEWDGAIDQLEVVQSFKFADFSKIVVAPLDKTAIPAPPRSENTYEDFQKVMANADATFVKGLKGKVDDYRKLPVESGTVGGLTADFVGPAASDAPPAPSAAAGPKVLFIRAKIIVLDPGSRAARMTVGFGAGAARAAVAAEILDGQTGQVLLRVTHEKRAGFAMFGGGYEKMMTKSIREVAEDFAKIFKSF